MTDILTHAIRSLDPQMSAYAYWYARGKKDAAAIKVGDTFLGSFNYADLHCGKNAACRATPEWKGAAAGYYDGLPRDAKGRGVTVNAEGKITKIG